jgi:hypothetical protein
MNNSGDAAEQIVRMTLDGAEVAVRLTGAAAKEIALLIMAALKSPSKGSSTKLKGKERLNSMLKSGKALEIFSIKERDLQTFVQEAKRYGIVYCVLRNSNQTPDSLCDIMVKADDAPKINRLVERFKFATVDRAKIESEIVHDMEKHNAEAPSPAVPLAPTVGQPGEPEINDINKLLDELMGTDEGKAAAETEKSDSGMAAQDKPEPAKQGQQKPAPRKNPQTAGKDTPVPEARDEAIPLANGGRNTQDSPPPPKTSPSEPSSGSKKRSENHILNKPSVKEELREITVAKKAKEAETLKRMDTPALTKAKENPVTTHKQPQNKRNQKSSKAR